MEKKGIVILIVAVMITAIGCKGDKNVAVNGVDIVKKTLTLDVGETEILYIIISPSDATNREVTWASSHPAIANVSSNGEVEAIGPGEAVIVVTTKDGGKNAGVPEYLYQTIKMQKAKRMSISP